jgi:hypothetical protein
MNTLKTVFDKITSKEVKLESHLVELTLVDDIKKASAKASGLNSQALQTTSKATNEWLQAVSSLKEGLALAQKAQFQAKELGIDTKMFDNYVSSINDDLALYNKRLKAVSSI